ncbi:MAG TPA: hypothetical protein VN087_11060 [Verrucomicrobiae bacterium]|jgi:hypothetical protein|nr:hypothetical protein [Verrucomicrobiae bacterium]
MKKRILLFIPILLLVTVPLLAQDDSHSKKTTNCSGVISQDGLSFVSDKDHRTWKIANPAVLRDMEGHHAKLVYHLTSNAGEIFVTSAAIVQEQPTAAHNSGDPAVPK